MAKSKGLSRAAETGLLIEPSFGWSLRRRIKNKVKIFGEIIFEESREKSGEISRKEPSASVKGGRGKDIELLVRTRSQLSRNWRKAAPEERGLA